MRKEVYLRRGNTMNKICYGCGATLQSLDKEKEGFIIEKKLEEGIYCERCFKMIHYGEKKSSLTPKKTEDIIKTINKNAKCVFFIIDFINIFDEVIDLYKKIKVSKTLIISKSDIIPKNVSFNQIRNYLKVTYDVKEPIIFTSKKSNLNTLYKNLYEKKEVYFLGLTNAGKSTLINAILDRENSSMNRLTTSYKENTTQDFLRIKLPFITLIDSPGFKIDNFEVDKTSNIDDEIKPITYQNKLVCTYNIGNFIKFKIEGKTSLIFYFSKHLKIERFYNKEIIGTTFKLGANKDLVICGLGFIKTTEKVNITVSEDLMKYINIRPSIVGGNYE